MRLKDVSKKINYDKKSKVIDKKRVLKTKETEVKSQWGGGGKKKNKSNYLVYLTIFTLIFFLITIGIANYVKIAGIDRTVSPGKITIVTQGAKVVDGGVSSPLSINIANGNPVTIKDISLTVIYPIGTYSKDEVGLVRMKDISIESIESGDIVKEDINPIFYGISGEKKEIVYELEYSIDGSRERIKKTDSYDIVLRTSPIILSKPTHTSPTPGKEFSFTIKVKSNTADPVETAYLYIKHPENFSITSSNPRPSNTGNTLWNLGSITANSERTVTIKGILQGREGDGQSISASIYAGPSGGYNESVIVAKEDVIFDIGRSFVDARIVLDGRYADTLIVSPEGKVKGSVEIINNDLGRLQGLEVVVSLSGSGLNESSINPKDGGYFDGIKKQIIWNEIEVEEFSLFDISETISLDFDFNALPDVTDFAQSQKNINISVSAKATREKTGKLETVQDIANSQVKLRSAIQVIENTLYNTSKIKNEGPVPPKVGERTSYVLKYYIKNSGNEITDIKLKIPFQREVVFTQQVSGLARGEWTYNSKRNEIDIEIPSLAAVVPDSSRSIELKVIVEPDDNDAGDILNLTKEGTFEAYDTYTGETFQDKVERLTTYIEGENLGSYGHSVVTR